MIIYGEDIARTRLTAAELKPNGKHHDRWPAVEKEARQRAEESIAIERPGHPAEN
jgi:hypothetical protein